MVAVLFVAAAGDDEVAEDLLEAIGGVGRWQVLDDLLDSNCAAAAFPDIFARGFELERGGAETDGVDAAGAEHLADLAEVLEHRGVGGQVADGVDRAEREVHEWEAGGEAGHVADEDAALARGQLAAGVLDHGFGKIETDGIVAAAGGFDEVAAGAAGGFEPGHGLGRFGAELARDEFETVNFVPGAGGVQDVEDLGVFIKTVCHGGGG